MSLTAIIADDEPPARRKLVRLLAAHGGVAIIGEASTGPETIELLQQNRPDVLFLDIQMPGLDGFQVLEMLGASGEMAVVFVTAFDEYAVRAFEVQAMDYLLKPVSEERLAKLLARLQTRGSKSQSSPYWKRILVRGPRLTHFVDVQSIDWIEADRNYVAIHCGPAEHLIRTTIEAFVSKLDPEVFARVNRSTAINLDRVRELRPWTHGEYRVVLHTGHEVSWSRRYVASGLNRFLPAP